MAWDFSEDELADMGLRSVSVTPDGDLDRVRIEATSGEVVHIMLRGEARGTGQREALWLAAQALGGRAIALMRVALDGDTPDLVIDGSQ